MDSSVKSAERAGAAPRDEAEPPIVPPLERFKRNFQRLGTETLDLVNEMYCENAVFMDPVHKLRGSREIREYFARMYEGVGHCEFDFQREITEGDTAVLTWVMRMRHKRFRPTETLELQGISLLRFHEKVFYHRDYFDLGAMIYERVPVLGHFVRKIKEGLRHG